MIGAARRLPFGRGVALPASGMPRRTSEDRAGADGHAVSAKSTELDEPTGSDRPDAHKATGKIEH
jgi:hypothetical protein